MIIIGIAGPSGSGKTTLASTLAKHYGDRASVLSLDMYFKAFDYVVSEKRGEINFDHPSALDLTAFERDLKALRDGQSIDVFNYDFSKHRKSDEKTFIPSKEILIVEGVLLFYEASILHLLDVKVFMDTPLDYCIARRMVRDIKERGRAPELVLAQYERDVAPMCRQYVLPTKAKADLLVEEANIQPIVELVERKESERKGASVWEVSGITHFGRQTQQSPTVSGLSTSYCAT